MPFNHQHHETEMAYKSIQGKFSSLWYKLSKAYKGQKILALSTGSYLLNTGSTLLVFKKHFLQVKNSSGMKHASTVTYQDSPETYQNRASTQVSCSYTSREVSTQVQQFLDVPEPGLNTDSPVLIHLERSQHRCNGSYTYQDQKLMYASQF